MLTEKYKCRICGIEHVRGEIYKEHLKYRAGHKQKRRGPYKKKTWKKAKPMINIRYYKGIYKLERIGIPDNSKKCLYRALEDGPNWVKDDLIICPYRLCWRNRK